MNNYKLNDWTLDYLKFVPESEKHSEALTTLANGYMGTRGAHEEGGNEAYHYPATYIAGLYNRLYTNVSGKKVDNEDLVRCPDWTHIHFRIGNDPWFSIDEVEVLHYLKQLDLKSGVLLRKLRFRDKKGRITALSSERLVSMHHPNVCALGYRLTAENYSGKVKILSGLNGDVENKGVERYKQLNSLHLKPLSGKVDSGRLQLEMQTTESKVTLAMVARHEVYGGFEPTAVKSVVNRNKKFVGQEFSFSAIEGETFGLYKLVAVKTSQDKGVKKPLKEAGEILNKIRNYNNVMLRHVKAWEKIWKQINIEITGDKEQERLLRLHSYHLASCATVHNKNIDASIPARGLHGEAYRGHIFWDDLFLFPFFCNHNPEVAKSLLMYRVRRLDKAREYARENGYRGAMYPWQSGRDGREETQKLHLNPISGKWGIDLSRRQRHVSLAIFYDIWEYVHLTGDKKFLTQHGAEVLLEIGRFWASISTRNQSTGKYDIAGVMGPDEFHEKLPGAKDPGVTNNAYTNLFVSWALQKCLELLKTLPKNKLKSLQASLRLEDSEIAEWREISQKIDVEVKNGIVSHFQGYLGLKEVDWAGYRKKFTNIGRMDRILKSEGLSPDDYRLSKQADFLMLFYVFTLDEVKSIFKNLGHSFDKEQLEKNYYFYLKRTSHGSTLSYVVHTHLAALLGNVKEGYAWFKNTLQADISDIQGGTTKEGIHTGLMGGTIQLLIRSFAGVDTSSDSLRVVPRLPAKWQEVKFSLQFKKTNYDFEIAPARVRVKANKDGTFILVAGKKVSVTKTFKNVHIKSPR